MCEQLTSISSLPMSHGSDNAFQHSGVQRMRLSSSNSLVSHLATSMELFASEGNLQIVSSRRPKHPAEPPRGTKEHDNHYLTESPRYFCHATKIWVCCPSSKKTLPEKLAFLQQTPTIPVVRDGLLLFEYFFQSAVIAPDLPASGARLCFDADGCSATSAACPYEDCLLLALCRWMMS